MDAQAAFIHRSALADKLMDRWHSHTVDSEPVRSLFFDEIERAIIGGRMAPVSRSVDGNGLVMALSPAADANPWTALETSTYRISFTSPSAQEEFIGDLRELLRYDPHANLD